jgi:hypothetical protein
MGQPEPSEARLAILTALSVELERCEQWLRSRLTNIGKLFFNLGFDITSFGIRTVFCSCSIGSDRTVQSRSVLSLISIASAEIRASASSSNSQPLGIDLADQRRILLPSS